MRRSCAVVFAVCSIVCCGPALAGKATYSVAPGDSLWTIAAHYGVSLAKLEKANGLTDSSILQLGQVLTIPIAAPRPVAAPKPVAAAKPATAAATHHNVVSGPVAAARSVVIAPDRKHPVAKRRVARRHQQRDPDTSTQRIAVESALWAATHDGNPPPAIPGIESFSVAQRMLAVDARITRTALRFLGVPYSWGGTGFGGVDCSGLVWTVFARNGIQLPRMADEQFAIGRRVAMSLLMPGDLVFFETYTSGASHVGIYLGNGRFIHASLRGVVIDQLSMSYYAARYIGARRLVQ